MTLNLLKIFINKRLKDIEGYKKENLKTEETKLSRKISEGKDNSTYSPTVNPCGDIHWNPIILLPFLVTSYFLIFTQK